MDESEWDEFEQILLENNTLSLRNFSRECDRYKLSNRGAAKLDNALLLD